MIYYAVDVSFDSNSTDVSVAVEGHKSWKEWKQQQRKSYLIGRLVGKEGRHIFYMKQPRFSYDNIDLFSNI